MVSKDVEQQFGVRVGVHMAMRLMVKEIAELPRIREIPVLFKEINLH